MKIALIGYGKMGKTIEELALSKGHEVVLKIDVSNESEFNQENLQKADVAIEFTTPESAVANLKKCFDYGIPVVCGSTGWLEHWDEITTYCKGKNGTFFYASNFSIGVNIFFELNKLLAALMKDRKEYDVSIEEIHHTHKKDAPSGTGITLAEGVIQNLETKNKWVLGEASNDNELSIISKRIDPAPGTHIVTYASMIDDIEIKHTAHSRKGFAAGALAAASFIHNRKGIFNMNDLLKQQIG